MKSISEIRKICKEYSIRNYTINDDGSIDVDGNVDLEDKGLTELPLNFNKVSGYFDCFDNKLTTLKGSPKYITDGFDCSDNKLTSLEFGPIEVSGDFHCDENRLTSLEFSPKIVGSDFGCIDNEIRDLYGISDYIGRFLYCNEKNPISSIIYKPVDMDFIRAFNSYRVIKDGKVQLKRLKYVMETFNMDYDLEKIKEHYEII